MNDAFGHPQSVVVLRAGRRISPESLWHFSSRTEARSVVLAGRDRVALAKAAEELRPQCGAACETVTFDASELDDVEKTVMRCFEAAAEPVDLVIVAVGELGSQDGGRGRP